MSEEIKGVPSTSHKESSKRIAKNSLVIYGRSLFTMILSLYTSRVILKELGETDFGLYNLVGGVLTFFTLFQGVLNGSIARYLTLDMGIGDEARLKDTFGTAKTLLLIFSLVLLIPMEVGGLWLLYNKITIPPERMEACLWVFHSAIISFYLGVISVPYNALIYSAERFSFSALTGVVSTILVLLGVMIIPIMPGDMDKLKYYAIMNLAVSSGIILWNILYAYRNFSASHTGFAFNKEKVKPMAQFAGWTLIGSVGDLFSGQVKSILMNNFSSAAVLAASGVAAQVYGSASKLGASVSGAIGPMVTKSYASGDESYLKLLIYGGTKMIFFTTLFFAVPIYVNLDFLLNLWLDSVPEYTVDFAQLFLGICLTSTFGFLIGGYYAAIGKIRNMQIASLILKLFFIGACYLILEYGGKPYEIVYPEWVMIVMGMYLNMVFLSKLSPFRIGGFMKEVVLICLFVTAIAFVPSYFVQRFIAVYSEWGAFFASGTLSVILCIGGAYYIGLNSRERLFASKMFRERFLALFTSNKND